MHIVNLSHLFFHVSIAAAPFSNDPYSIILSFFYKKNLSNLTAFTIGYLKVL